MDFSEKDKRYKDSLLYKVAWLYYIDGLTQKEIADRLSVSRIKIIKMLEESRQKKIVRFHFSTVYRDKNKIEQQLIKKYHLKDVFVVPWSSNENLAEDLGQATAMYLNDLIKDDAFVGVGYGETMGAFLRHLSGLTDKNLSVISMTGGVMPYIRQIGNGIIDIKHYLIPAPLVVGSKELTEAILKEKSVSDIVEMTEKINVVVSSLGGMQEHSTILKSGLLTPEKFESLKSKGAVGDMLMHFMDEDGNLVDDEIEDRIISTKLDKLKNYDYIIVAAGGDSKLPIIHTAITHGFVNVLITDENTAELLLGDCTWKKEENTY